MIYILLAIWIVAIIFSSTYFFTQHRKKNNSSNKIIVNNDNYHKKDIKPSSTITDKENITNVELSTYLEDEKHKIIIYNSEPNYLLNEKDINQLYKTQSINNPTPKDQNSNINQTENNNKINIDLDRYIDIT